MALDEAAVLRHYNAGSLLLEAVQQRLARYPEALCEATAGGHEWEESAQRACSIVVRGEKALLAQAMERIQAHSKEGGGVGGQVKAAARTGGKTGGKKMR